MAPHFEQHKVPVAESADLAADNNIPDSDNKVAVRYIQEAHNTVSPFP